MATLERIRQRSGLLIGIIGVAMLAFILTDLLGSGNSLFRADANVVGKVNGRTVESREFAMRMDEREAIIRQQNPQQAQFITRKQIADGVWNEIVREEVMGEQYDNLGFMVSSRELYQRLKANPSIQSAPAFKDQVTGQFSEGMFQQYITNLRDNMNVDPQAAEAYQQWVDFERGQKDMALQTKYNKAVEKGLYVPKQIAKASFQSSSISANIKMAALEFSSIKDEEVEVTDADFKNYYNENKEDFKAEKSADILYVNFPIAASEADRKELQDELKGYISAADSAENFAFAADDSLYASSRSDIRVMPDYYREANLPQGLDTTIMEQPVGYVTEPYEANGYYAITKVTDKRNLPDSVEARHILISFQGLQGGNETRNQPQAKALVDSLLEVVKADTSKFAAIAKELSDDPGSGANGGELGWFGDKQMVASFSNFSFRNEKGEIAMVPSQFGYHIIEILDQKGSSEAVKLLSISREIAPTEQTIDDIYSAASEFASSVSGTEDFTAKAEEKGYTPRPATGLLPFDESIPGLGNNREIIRWANGINSEDTEIGDIQLFNNGNSSYVVVLLTDAMEDGYRSLDAVKENIRPMVINSKKGDMLMKKFEGATGDIDAIGAAAGAPVTTQAVNFGAPSLGRFGSEPKVIGTIFGMNDGETSKPIKGNRGVFVIQLTNKTPAAELPDYSEQQNQQQQATRGRVQGQVFLSLKENAKLDDRRAKFY
ncbi:parvulin-like peptidyl-prolyl isomerase [Owenweeksia hongkongensis DSM 17368]|uniref:Periplasmic chaperone PpiD n=1 Tax=Owenweeksia hongkongensis (strain DSM 17368 / CIP 108786 / JCM 12287 / NRRL B-23963 / UST20020801) TaxID=926562 RepID=G8R5W0_OWEHD|nr:peptidylprolyl isomerase [Owenweeksia hongkongensis]AEV31108.1 parvulin-like peptidyl-prolyl isomerase [Owenweeksia hongkongensis DSM 17368]